MKILSLDFGASTVDMIFWQGDDIIEIKSFETNDHQAINSLMEFLEQSKVDLTDVSKIYLTGGKTKFFEDSLSGLSVSKVNEIDAIGRGAWFLSQGFLKDDKFLAVSLGTGTCMVLVSDMDGMRVEHIGGTGIGGGTFLGLCKELLGETDIKILKKIFAKGDKSKVDLSVGEIVGEGIGMVSAQNTASNLGKIARNVDFNKADLAAGIVNLIAQAIASNIIFACLAHNVKEVVLLGKLTLMEEVFYLIKSLLEERGLNIHIPENAEHAMAVGARITRRLTNK